MAFWPAPAGPLEIFGFSLEIVGFSLEKIGLQSHTLAVPHATNVGQCNSDVLGLRPSLNPQMAFWPAPAGPLENFGFFCRFFVARAAPQIQSLLP